MLTELSGLLRRPLPSPTHDASQCADATNQNHVSGIVPGSRRDWDGATEGKNVGCRGAAR